MDAPLEASSTSLGPLLRAVVKVMTVSDAPDYDQPWQTGGPSSSSGSGVVVETGRGLRVLTNGHCVQDHVFIDVRRYGDPRRYVAEVEALGHECDLALLRVEDRSFFQGLEAVPFGPLPQLTERVSVFGYPIGGDRLSITQGIVSRVDLVRYSHSQRRLLGLQIDAAINEGNSGGPVLKDGRIVGVAFQALEHAEQIGYVIPSEVVVHFLRDVEAGVEDGFPDLGVTVQPLESEAHRGYLGLPKSQEAGVRVVHINYESSAWGALSEGDVLLEVDGVEVASDGTVPLREGELVELDYVISRRHVGERMDIRVFRDGQERRYTLDLRPPRPLVAESRYDVRPSYYIFGGLLFAPLTRDYLKSWDDPWWRNAPEDLMALYERGVRTEDRTEAVVLQKVLADRANQGYHDFESLLVEAVQGTHVRSLRHLVETIEDTHDDYVSFDLSDGRVVVIERGVALHRHAPILARYGVPRDRSEDLADTVQPRRRLRGVRRAGRRSRARRAGRV